ncbi:MerR family transcriptional regulator [Streptomyces sp. JJ36]|uniref:transcriptional regulator FtsR n=1 Tax=Streptomyces sp. JJ36 TaxID=2736645 RepID=UPI001F1C57F7|nr:MerR family transcriptional regulator [Streptomyces sp. JJ36]MCF6524318.1 MerR family transcriptional regulator [Streptomyces sp. JJ36]
MPHPSPGGAATGTAPGARGTRSIGAVLQALRDEFPGITLATLRFLEAEGLVKPERAPSGHRRFRPGDVDRLTRVLRLQRDHCLPLRVIREHLETAGEHGLPAGRAAGAGDAPRPPGVSGETAGAPARREPEMRLGRAELAAAAGAGPEEAAEWQAYGLLGPGDDGRYGAGQVEIARLLAALGGHGLEARHLRMVRIAAEREAALIEQLLAPRRRHRDAQVRAGAETEARELGALAARLHAVLVRSALGLREP